MALEMICFSGAISAPAALGPCYHHITWCRASTSILGRFRKLGWSLNSMSFDLVAWSAFVAALSPFVPLLNMIFTIMFNRNDSLANTKASLKAGGTKWFFHLNYERKAGQK
jgi:hypothetical protein